MPAGVGYDMNDPAVMAAMEQMIGQGGGAPGGMPPAGPGGPETGATDDLSGEADVVAMLAEENVQLRALLGLGPDDPIPPLPAADPGGGAAPGGVGTPPA